MSELAMCVSELDEIELNNLKEIVDRETHRRKIMKLNEKLKQRIEFEINSNLNNESSKNLIRLIERLNVHLIDYTIIKDKCLNLDEMYLFSRGSDVPQTIDYTFHSEHYTFMIDQIKIEIDINCIYHNDEECSVNFFKVKINGLNVDIDAIIYLSNNEAIEKIYKENEERIRLQCVGLNDIFDIDYFRHILYETLNLVRLTVKNT